MKLARIAFAATALIVGTAVPALSQPAPVTTPPVDNPFVPFSGQPGKDVVWVPTAQSLVDRMLDMAGATTADYVIDLGSGDGRTVITAAKRGIRALGVEFNPEMVSFARAEAEKAGVADRATFVEGDIFKTDFSGATVLTLFLLPELNQRLRPTILSMKPGTRVVSNTFDMGDWKADDLIEAGGSCTSFCKAYKWVVPARVAGTWSMSDGELRLDQSYQNVSGNLVLSGRTIPISDGRLDGTNIAFTAGGLRYTGTVDGDRLDARAETGERSISGMRRRG